VTRPRQSWKYFEQLTQIRIILIYNFTTMLFLTMLASLFLVTLCACWIFRK